MHFLQFVHDNDLVQNLVDKSDDITTASTNWHSIIFTIIDRNVLKISLKKLCVPMV